jgi:hypothetical protein
MLLINDLMIKWHCNGTIKQQAKLDTLAIQMERNRLSEENTKVASGLRKYLDSLTIPERLKRKYNILVVGLISPYHNDILNIFANFLSPTFITPR